jgi:hypothetical protein
MSMFHITNSLTTNFIRTVTNQNEHAMLSRFTVLNTTDSNRNEDDLMISQNIQNTQNT